ncbi:MAG TPA: XRE family transcriptional regulator [Acidimicrobiales bacterium]|jgi:quercetin dioxygenase-like cupin family protein/DNA-binding XRE family transcriptional regulator|nr:XRE family transcriptional regulator [Acidimicrobiales bacterium]
MELHETLTSIAESLREERTRAGFTLEQLAQRADLSTAHLSRLESGDRQPSVAALIALSRALGVSMSTLLGERRGAPAIATYAPGGPSHEANGLTIAPCSGFPGSTTLQALQITISPDRVPPEPARHRGEEWIYVVAGRLLLEFDGQSHVLEPGTSAHFDAGRPHRLGADGMTTEVLVVAADGPNDFRNHPLFRTSITDH